MEIKDGEFHGRDCVENNIAPSSTWIRTCVLKFGIAHQQTASAPSVSSRDPYRCTQLNASAVVFGNILGRPLWPEPSIGHVSVIDTTHTTNGDFDWRHLVGEILLHVPRVEAHSAQALHSRPVQRQ